MRHKYPSDIHRELFEEKVWPVLQKARKKTKPINVDVYDVFCGILYVLKSGCQWRMLPSDFPKWRTCYDYWQKWSAKQNNDLSLLEEALKKCGRGHTTRPWGGCPDTFYKENLSKVEKVLADGGYTGTPFSTGVKEIFGAEVEIAKRNELHKFEVIPKRWVVERSFSWLEKRRRLWKNCERKVNSSLNMVALAFLALLIKRS